MSIAAREYLYYTMCAFLPLKTLSSVAVLFTHPPLYLDTTRYLLLSRLFCVLSWPGHDHNCSCDHCYTISCALWHYSTQPHSLILGIILPVLGCRFVLPLHERDMLSPCVVPRVYLGINLENHGYWWRILSSFMLLVRISVFL